VEVLIDRSLHMLVEFIQREAAETSGAKPEVESEAAGEK
jgi:hypothetical protein